MSKMEIPTRNIIFLQGIFFDQIKTVEDRMMAESQISSSENIETEQLINQCLIIPSRFKNIKSWKEITKNLQLRCWYCNLAFMGVPCFIPKQVRSTNQGKEFDTCGWFCGFACAYSYLNNNAEYRINKSYFDKLTMMKMLFTQFYSKKVKEFYEAPNKYNLATYGGYLDLSDFKIQLRQANQKIHIAQN
jgi:hypothetical protein